MLLSIVIPVYNVEKYLDQCVSSALQLDCQKEIILVNDGSTDGSGTLCDAWAARDAQIRVIHQENGGLSAARNTGIRSSTGDYIMLLDSDDYLDTAESVRMLSHLQSGSDVVMGLYREVFPEEGIERKENSPAFEQMQGLVSVDTFLSNLPIDGNGCYMVAVRFLCRRDFVLENHLFFLPGIYHEDEEWSQRLFAAAQSIYVTNCYFYQYRQARTGSITATVKPKRIFDRFVIMGKGVAILETGVSAAKADYIKKQLALIYLANLMDYRILSKQDKARTAADYRKYSCYLGFINSKIGQILAIVLKIIGFRATGSLLGIANKIRRGK